MSITTYKLNSQYIKRLKGYAEKGERIWIVAGSGSGKTWLASKVGGWDLDLSADHITQPDGKTKWEVFLPRIPSHAKIVAGCFQLPREDVFMASWKPTRIVFIDVSQSRYEKNYIWKAAAKMFETRFKQVLDPTHPIKVFHKIESLEGSKPVVYAKNVEVYREWIHNKEIGPKIPVDIVKNDFDSFEGSAWHGNVLAWGEEVVGLVDVWHHTKDLILRKKVRDLLIETSLDPKLNPAYREAARWLMKLPLAMTGSKAVTRARNILAVKAERTPLDGVFKDFDGKLVRAWDVSSKLKEAFLKSVGMTDAEVKAGKLKPLQYPSPGAPPIK